jgi:hypothetical protein
VWLSATPDVAGIHKINYQFTVLRQLIMEIVHFTSHKQCASFFGNYLCKRYANLFGAESGYAFRTNIQGITEWQEVKDLVTYSGFHVDE